MIGAVLPFLRQNSAFLLGPAASFCQFPLATLAKFCH
jgi:hypothetical protein